MLAKLYTIAFLIVFAAFAIANYYSYVLMQESKWGSCEDCPIFFGFPFTVWIAGVRGRTFLWYGVLGDVLVFLSLGFALGWLLRRVLSLGSHRLSKRAA
jgi:hypothetical protein